MARPPSAASREDVLAAAITILRDEGPGALTVRTIAQVSGCSTMAVYTHFDGKAGLVDAIIAEGYASLKSHLDQAADNNAYGDVLVSVAVGYRNWALAHPTEYQAMYTSLVPGFTPSARTLSLGDISFDAHRDRVQRELGLDAASADSVARHLWASVHGHVVFELLYGAPGDDTVRMEAFVRAARWMRRGVAS